MNQSFLQRKPESEHDSAQAVENESTKPNSGLTVLEILQNLGLPPLQGKLSPELSLTSPMTSLIHLPSMLIVTTKFF